MKNLTKVQDDKDIVTKEYLDGNALTEADADEKYLKLSGGTMSGDIVIPKDVKIAIEYPSYYGGTVNTIRNTQGILAEVKENGTMEYLDLQYGGWIQLDGGISVTNGTSSFNNSRVLAVGDPTARTDAVNKHYVDDLISPLSESISTIETLATDANTKATSAETKATDAKTTATIAAQVANEARTAVANKQDKITGTANKLVGINSSGVAAVTDTFTINGPIQIGRIRMTYNTSTASLDFEYV